SLLSRNAEQNHLGNVTCVNQAVAAKPGVRTLMLDPMDSGSHSLVFGSSDRTIEVKCGTLDEVFRRFSLTKGDYLKMDCEGAEYEILENSVQRLCQIRRISMETHTIRDRNAEDLAKLLRENRFDVRLFGGDRLYATRRAY